MPNSAYDYDLVVIGSGPGGQRAAIQAAKLRKKVALIERKGVLGGVCVNTGTIPSKTLREAVVRLAGLRDREVYGDSYSVKSDITVQDLLYRVDHVIRHELDTIRSQLQRNHVDLIAAEASFVDPHRLRFKFLDGSTFREVTAASVIIAVGTGAARDPHIPFDGKRVMVSDDIQGMTTLPRTMTVVGAGVIGLEYASIFAALGVRVTLVDKRNRVMPNLDTEIVETLDYHLRECRLTMRLNEEVSGIEHFTDERGEFVRMTLASGKQLVSEVALYSIGRMGATSELNLAAVGLQADDRGRLKVNKDYQTAVPHIYAVGDVIGFPSLASTSMEQGRLAACHALGAACTSMPELFPYAIYTIPEISYVGKTEEELTIAGIPFETGRATYKEIAKGQIIGDQTGMVKLIFHLKTHELLGVHIIGEGASELIHIGQAVLASGLKVEYFRDTVFNFPTLAEAYKSAAFDGLNRLGG